MSGSLSGETPSIGDPEREDRLAPAPVDVPSRPILYGPAMVAWDWDLATDLAGRTRALETMFGLAPGSSGEFERLCHPDDLDRVQQALHKTRAGEAPYEVEYRIVLPDGSERQVADRTTMLHETAGRPNRMIGVSQDVTDRQRSEAALYRYELLAGHSRDIILFMGRDGQILEANAAAIQAYGYSRDELLRLTIHDLRDHETQRVTAVEMAEADEHGLLFQTIHRRKDGTTFPVEVSSRGATVAGRRTLISVIRDISRRRRTEEELRESKQRQELAQQAGRIGTFEWDPASGGTVMIAGMEAVYGEPPGGCIGEYDSWRQRIHPEDVGHVERCVEDALAAKAEYNTEYRILWPDGTIHWVGARGQVHRDEQGRPTRLIGVNMDITDRKRAEEALKNADRRKDEFLAMLAHELRNPLSAISNALSLARHPSCDAETLAWAQEILERQVKQLARLVDDLLDVSRISRGKLQLRMAPIELRTVLGRAVETARPLIEQKGHELTTVLGLEPLWVHGDATRLEQVVVNLLANAAKYTDDGGRISLLASQDGPQVSVRVQDTGVGVPAEKLSTIFDLFAQVDHSLDRSQGGLGIGLTLVQKLVEMHGGTVAAFSEGRGRGSEFVIHLPALDRGLAGQAGSEGTAPDASAGTGSNVLIVDDNIDSATSLARVLEISGYRTEMVHDGKEAVAVARSFRPEVVLLDIGLPGLDGYEVAARLRADDCCREAVLVAVTGYGQDEDHRRSREAGFDGHLVKPVDVQALLALLARSTKRGKTK